MEAKTYQQEARKFSAFGNNAVYAYAGLAEEAGEVLGKFAKFIRRNDGMDPARAERNFPTAMRAELDKYREDLAKELGDVLWMVAAIATAHELDLGDIMSRNIEKLTDRLNRGVIVGEGDNR